MRNILKKNIIKDNNHISDLEIAKAIKELENIYAYLNSI